LQEAANDGLGRALCDLYHTPLGSSLPITPNDAYLDAILVEYGTHFIGGKIDVRGTIITGHKAVPVAMPLHHSFNFIQQTAVGA
jgi:hypothetical protein